MPLVERSSYRPPAWLRNAHLQTYYPTLFRKVEGVTYSRERIETPDGDFLDLDWSAKGNRKLVVVGHGLEGNSGRGYVLGMVRIFNENGWDALGWNYRGCSGEPNRLLRSYHSGATEDLETVVRHAAQKGYSEIVLIGFSLGGNVILKFLGENGDRLTSVVKKAVVFSVPADLAGSAAELDRFRNRIYMIYFLRKLEKKLIEKKSFFPEIDLDGFRKIRNFQGFDDRYTAPLHGFRDARDYWARCSSAPLVGNIRIPTLIVNAKNDPFLSAECYPVNAARSNGSVFLEMPEYGGHVSFVEFKKDGYYWSERRAVEFVQS